MVTKMELLRQGKSVEREPGVYVRLNKENKRLEDSKGKYFDVSDMKEFFPSDEKELALNREKERLKSQTYGSGVKEFGQQALNRGVFKAGQDWLDYFHDKESYPIKKQAREEISEEYSKENPYSSMAATATSFIPDIIATRGMSGMMAAPTLTALHAGPKLAEKPLEVAGEAALGALGGKFIDYASKGLGNIARRRGESRSLPGRQAAVREQNVLGQEATDMANAYQTAEHNILRNNITKQNEYMMNLHQEKLMQRKNDMVKAQNEYLQKRNLRTTTEQENKFLLSEYNTAKKLYEQQLKELPNIQNKLQQEYSNQIIENAEKLSKAIPENSKIYSSHLGTGDFVKNSIDETALATTQEGKLAKNIINSIFPEGEVIAGKEIIGKYKALEGAIVKAKPEVRAILSDFKDHLGQRFTNAVTDNISYNRIVPSLKKQLEREVESIINGMGLPKIGIGSQRVMNGKAKKNLEKIFNELTPEDFFRKYQSGEIKEKIINEILAPTDFTISLSGLKKGKSFLGTSQDEAKRAGLNIIDPAQQKYETFSELLKQKIEKPFSKSDYKLLGIESDVQRVVGAKPKSTLGIAESAPPPEPPIMPNLKPLPKNPRRPQVPPHPNAPRPLETPQAPTPQEFVPTPEPVLPPASNMAESAGDFLERDLMGGRSLVNNPLTKLGALKYVLGKAALPMEAAYLGMKGLTSPTAGGEMARMTFKQGGIQAINSWAEKYPSYKNGVLQSPQDRRSLTKEIEDDHTIPLEKKAVTQSKINRGIPLEQNS